MESPGDMTRRLKFYIPIVFLILAAGLPARISSRDLPHWYIVYAGDFFWAMLVFFLYCLIYDCLIFRLTTASAFYLALATAYFIEISQLYHPSWLETLRSIKVFSLILGSGFLWSDIAAYTLGISSAAIIDRLVLNYSQGD